MELTKPKLTDTFYNELQSYKYYNNLLPKGVSAYNFGLFQKNYNLQELLILQY